MTKDLRAGDREKNCCELINVARRKLGTKLHVYPPRYSASYKLRVPPTRFVPVILRNFPRIASRSLNSTNEKRSIVVSNDERRLKTYLFSIVFLKFFFLFTLPLKFIHLSRIVRCNYGNSILISGSLLLVFNSTCDTLTLGFRRTCLWKPKEFRPRATKLKLKCP